MSYDRILLATDLSDNSDNLIAVTAAYAAAFQSKVFVIHVVPPHPGFVGYPKPTETGAMSSDVPVGWEYDRKVLSEQLRAKHKTLQEFADRLSETGCSTEALLLEGAFVENLLSEIDRLDIGMVIIGSHEPGAINDFFVGNAAKSVVGRLTCPLLVVPPPQSGSAPLSP